MCCNRKDRHSSSNIACLVLNDLCCSTKSTCIDCSDRMYQVFQFENKDEACLWSSTVYTGSSLLTNRGIDCSDQNKLNWSLISEEPPE